MSDDDRIAYLTGQDAQIAPEEKADLDELLDLLGDSTLWAEPSAELEDRVVAAVADERSARPNAVAKPNAPHHAPRPRIAQRWRFAGAAAAIVVVLGVGTYFVTRGTDGAGGQRFSAELTSPDGAAPVAGRVDFERTDSGWRVELDVRGLPRLDGGRFYQAWMRDADGTLVPVGTFNEGNDVVLWSGVSPVDYPMLTVTEEEADGDQASSGRRVLSGTVTPSD